MVSISPKIETWKLDPSHTLVEFSAKHMMFTTIKGNFKKVEATVDWDGADFTKSNVEATIDVASIFSGDEKRDGHLLSPDFFNVEEHPVINFKSTRIEPVKNDEFRIIGNLTVRGITREVTLDATFEGRGASPWGSEVAAFTAKTSFNRKDFGLQWNVALEAGGVLVGELVKIEIHAELTKQQAAA